LETLWLKTAVLLLAGFFFVFFFFFSSFFVFSFFCCCLLLAFQEPARDGVIGAQPQARQDDAGAGQ
jgi:hypothetical protein